MSLFSAPESKTNGKVVDRLSLFSAPGGKTNGKVVDRLRLLEARTDQVYLAHKEAFLGKQTVKSWTERVHLVDRTCPFSAPGSILIKTTLVKSLQRHCSAPRLCSYQNKYRQ